MHFLLFFQGLILKRFLYNNMLFHCFLASYIVMGDGAFWNAVFMGWSWYSPMCRSLLRCWSLGVWLYLLCGGYNFSICEVRVLCCLSGYTCWISSFCETPVCLLQVLGYLLIEIVMSLYWKYFNKLFCRHICSSISFINNTRKNSKWVLWRLDLC